MTIPAAKIDQAEAAYRQQFESPGTISAVHADGNARLAPAVARADPALHADRPVAEAGSGRQDRGFAGRSARPITTRTRRDSSCPSRTPSRAFPSCLRVTADPRAGERSAQEGGRGPEAGQGNQELPGIWTAGGKDFGRRLPGKHGRPQGDARGQAAAAGDQGVPEHEARRGQRPHPDRNRLHDRPPERPYPRAQAELRRKCKASCRPNCRSRSTSNCG